MNKRIFIVLVGIVLISGISISVFSYNKEQKRPPEKEKTPEYVSMAEGDIVWNKTFSGSLNSSADSIQQTSDGGYIVAGEIYSLSAGGYDVCVLRLDSRGNLLWDKKFGEFEKDERVADVQQTIDGGYILAGMEKRTIVPGQTESKGGEEHACVWKLDANGNLLWDKKFGGSRHDRFRGIRQISDGAYVVAGTTTSKGAGAGDVRIMKLDPKGNIIWDKVYGGKGNDWAFSLALTSDDGYAVTGYTTSKGAGSMDIWVLKLDANGNLLWDKTFGGKGRDDAFSIHQTSDKGYIVAGWTESKGAGKRNMWILKLDSNGNLLWDKVFGDKGTNSAIFIQQTSDDGYIAVGYSCWKDSNCSGRVLRLDNNGNLLWDKTFNNACSNCIQQTLDGDYIVSGQLCGGRVGAATWILKLKGK